MNARYWGPFERLLCMASKVEKAKERFTGLIMADDELKWLWSLLPRPSSSAFILLSCWIVFQGLLYAYLPGPTGYGQVTPAGHKLPYKVRCIRF